MKKLILFLTTTFFICLLHAQVVVTKMLTQNLVEPNGITALQPRFTWIMDATARNTRQLAYQIEVKNGKEVVWNSGRVNSDSSVMVIYKGNTLISNTTYTWHVKVWDQNNVSPAWSKEASFSTGYFNTNDWKAQWIMPGFEEAQNRPSPLFRKQFNAVKKIKSAVVFITSHGMYEASINGKRVGDAYLTPGWTSYNKRLQYQRYDVTNLVSTGQNVVGVTLGNGWYRGIIGFSNNKNTYGADIALLFQMHITYTDGTTALVISDDTWKSSVGSITYSEIYNGETIDARLEQNGWNTVSFNDSNWSGVKVGNFGYANLISTENELVKMQEKLTAKTVIVTPKKETVLDFGQNLSGWVSFKVKGKKGDTITIYHAEVLDKNGNFYTDNLRAAKAQTTYVLKGDGEEVFEPHFTWQGFRYIKVVGYPGDLVKENFTANVLHSDMQSIGTFTSSNTLINQLQHNIEWGQKGNFLDVPTDCPQRDERLGWTGDAQVFSRTAAFNKNVHPFFAKWLKDLEADQIEGRVPHVIPNVLGKGNVNSAGWSDVATIIPWNMYLAYGDTKILADQYNSMKAYVESVRAVANNNLWNNGSHYGDWLFFRPEDDNDGRSAVTDKNYIAQIFYANSIQLLVNAAKVLNNQTDVQLYTNLLQAVKAAFLQEYVTPNGRLVSSTQTAYVLALQYDMLPENLRAQTAKKLVDNIASYGNHLTTGFLGTPYLCHVLTRFGYTDVAYKLLLQENYPSWLYPVKKGATTIWERWDGQKPDGSFQSVGMNSFNHYAYGAIGDWMYRAMVGIDTYEDGVGYKHIKIMPHIGGGFKHAKASLETYYGIVSCGWQLEANNCLMEVTIPVNTSATVYIPCKDAATITENGLPINMGGLIKILENKDGYVKVELGSGHYQFVSKF